VSANVNANGREWWRRDCFPDRLGFATVFVHFRRGHSTAVHEIGRCQESSASVACCGPDQRE
jgi:hypothetical protein